MTDPSAAPPPPPPQEGFAPPPMPDAVTGGGLQLSTPGKRFGAWLLDFGLIIVTLGIGWFIWSLFVWGDGQSPGKKLLNMRCVKIDENRPANMGDMAMRELVGKWLLGQFTVQISTIVGGIMIITDDNNRQAIWDKIAQTTVVEDPNNYFNL